MQLSNNAREQTDMKKLKKLYMKLPLKTRKVIEKIVSPYTVIVRDADLGRKVVHYARTLKDALEWGGCYGVYDTVNIYHEGFFSRRLVATERDC